MILMVKSQDISTSIALIFIIVLKVSNFMELE